MHRFFFFVGCSALLGSLSIVHLHAAPSARSTDSQSTATQTRPVYLEYIPFDSGTFVPIYQEALVGRLRNAIRIGLNETQARGRQSGILRLTSPADIEAFRTRLKAPQHTFRAENSAITRFMLDADGGETQIFVDQEGIVSQGSRSWRLTLGDFAQLKQVLDRIYAAPTASK